MFIPFGVVVMASKSGTHSKVDIYSSKTQIEKLHPALAGLGTVITTNDDLPSSGIYKSSEPPAVIARRSIKVHKKHKAYMVQKSKKKTLKKLVPVGDFDKPMKAGWYYWLEPS
jgi:hypothetical protein